MRLKLVTTCVLGYVLLLTAWICYAATAGSL